MRKVVASLFISVINVGSATADSWRRPSRSPRDLYPPVPRWIKVAAYTVPFLVLPSALFRFYVIFAGPVCHRNLSAPAAAANVSLGLGENLYIASLSVVSMAMALLTIGLVRPWGEVAPRWVPVIGGRGIPVLAAVIPASLGAAFLIVLYCWGLIVKVFDIRIPQRRTDCVFPESGPEFLLIALAYAPLLAWAPLLIVVTVAYYLRRTRPLRAVTRGRTHQRPSKATNPVVITSADGDCSEHV